MRRCCRFAFLLLVGAAGLLGDVDVARACSFGDSLWAGYPTTTSPLPSNHRPVVLAIGVPEPRVATNGPAPTIERLAPPDGSDLFPTITRVSFAEPGSAAVAYTLTDPRGLVPAVSGRWSFTAPVDHGPPRFAGATQLELRAGPDECSAFGPPGTLYARLAWERPSEPLLVRIFSADARGEHRLARGVIADVNPWAPHAHAAIVRLPPGQDPARPICLLAVAEDMAGNQAPAATICCAPAHAPGAGTCAAVTAATDNAGGPRQDAGASNVGTSDAGANDAAIEDAARAEVAPPDAGHKRPSVDAGTAATGCGCRVAAPNPPPALGAFALLTILLLARRARSAERP